MRRITALMCLKSLPKVSASLSPIVLTGPQAIVFEIFSASRIDAVVSCKLFCQIFVVANRPHPRCVHKLLRETQALLV
jgi:hypothetical protein